MEAIPDPTDECRQFCELTRRYLDGEISTEEYHFSFSSYFSFYFSSFYSSSFYSFSSSFSWSTANARRLADRLGLEWDKSGICHWAGCRKPAVTRTINPRPTLETPGLVGGPYSDFCDEHTRLERKHYPHRLFEPLGEGS